MNDTESDKQEVGSSNTKSNINDSPKIKEFHEIKINSNLKKSQTRYNQKQELDIEDEDENRSYNSTNNQSLENNRKLDDTIQMIESKKISKKLQDGLKSDKQSSEGYDLKKKIAIVLSEDEEQDNKEIAQCGHGKDTPKKVGGKSLDDSIYCDTEKNLTKNNKSIEIMSFQRNSKQNSQGNSNKQFYNLNSSKQHSQESILMRKQKTEQILQKQNSFKGFEKFNNLEQYEVKLRSQKENNDGYEQQNRQNSNLKKRMDYDEHYNQYFLGQRQLKSRSPSKSAGEETDIAEDHPYKKMYKIQKYPTVQTNKFKENNFNQQKVQRQDYKNEILKDLHNYQPRNYHKAQKDESIYNKVDNVKIANHNIKITQELLEKAKDKRLCVLKSFDEDINQYKRKLNDVKKTQQSKQSGKIHYNSTMRQITERSENTDFSDINCRINNLQNSKTMKWKKESSQASKQQKSQKSRDQRNAPLNVPKSDNNIKKTYRWLISQYQDLEDKYNLNTKLNNGKKQWRDYDFDVTQPYELTDQKNNHQALRAAKFRSTSLESKTSMKSGICDKSRDLRSGSNERSYYKRISPDTVSNNYRKNSELNIIKNQYQKHQNDKPKQNYNNDLQKSYDTIENKNEKLQQINTFGFKSQFAERLYKYPQRPPLQNQNKFENFNIQNPTNQFSYKYEKNYSKKSPIVDIYDKKYIENIYIDNKIEKHYNYKQSSLIPDQKDKLYLQKSYSATNNRIITNKSISPNRADINNLEQKINLVKLNDFSQQKKVIEQIKQGQQEQALIKPKFSIERMTYDKFKTQVKDEIQTPAFTLNTLNHNKSSAYINTENTQSSRAKIDTIKNKFENFDLKKIGEGIVSVSNIDKNAEKILENNEKLDQQLASSLILSPAFGNLRKLDTSSYSQQTWLPQIYSELCKSRAIIAQKDNLLKQKDDELEIKNKLIQEKEFQCQQFELLKQNYQNLQNVFDEQKNKLEYNEEEFRNILQEKETQYRITIKEKEQEFIQTISDKENQFKQIIEQYQQIQSNSEEEQKQYQIQKELQLKQLELDFIEMIEKIDILINSQSHIKSLQNTLTKSQSQESSLNQSFALKEQYFKTIRKLEQIFNEIEIDKKKTEKENKRALSSSIKEMDERVEAINQKFEEMEQQKEDQEKVIESLKQIIMLQEKLRTSEFNKFNNQIRSQVLKGIDDLMQEEQSKNMLQKLAWVTELSDKTISKDNLNVNDTLKSYQQSIEQDNFNKIQDKENIQIHSQWQQPDGLIGLKQSFGEIKQIQSKEAIIQTDDYLIQNYQIEQCNDQKSQYSNNSSQKRLQVLSNDIKQNMNEILNEQLKQFMQTNVVEIANLKIENQNLNDKCLQEQKLVQKLQEDLKKKNKYELYYEKQKSKKFRNCGVQVGQSQTQTIQTDLNQSSSYYPNNKSTILYLNNTQSQLKDYQGVDANSKDESSDISVIIKSQHFPYDGVSNKENLNQIQASNTEKRVQKGQILNASQGISPSQFSKYECQLSNNTQSIEKNQNEKVDRSGKLNERLLKQNIVKNDETSRSKISQNMIKTFQNTDQDSYEISQTEIQILDQENKNDQQVFQSQIKQNQLLYQVLQNYIVKLKQIDNNGNVQDQNLIDHQNNLIHSIENAAQQLHLFSFDQNQIPQKLTNRDKKGSANFGDSKNSKKQSDIIQNWDDFSSGNNLIEKQNIQKKKQNHQKNVQSIHQSNESTVNKSLQPTEKTVIINEDISIQQNYQQMLNQKKQMMESSQQFSIGNLVPFEKNESQMMYQNYAKNLVNKYHKQNEEKQVYNNKYGNNSQTSRGTQNKGDNQPKNNDLDFSQTSSAFDQDEEHDDNCNVSEQIKQIECRKLINCELLDNAQNHKF